VEFEAIEYATASNGSNAMPEDVNIHTPTEQPGPNIDIGTCEAELDTNYTPPDSHTEMLMPEDVSDIIEVYFYHYRQLNDPFLYLNIFPSSLDVFSLTAVQREGLRAMYHCLNDLFGYVLIHDHAFVYRGYFTGYDKFIRPSPGSNMSLRNQSLIYRDGSEITVTSLRGVQLGRMLVEYFDNRVIAGRNFTESDFYIDDYTDIVNVMLGYDYMGIYDIGDLIRVSLYAHTKYFNFRVIGFYEQGVVFSNIFSPFETIYFDQAIIMPFFVLNYEPVNETNERFHNIYHTMKTTGSVRIMESFEDITESANTFYAIYNRYLAAIGAMASRHDLIFDMSLLPIPVFWTTN